jgi:hypothetical protein
MADYSTCWDFAAEGTCPRGENCKWKHEVSNSMVTRNHESQFCWNYQRTGQCPRGTSCRWIHELILMPWPSPGMMPLPIVPPSFEHDDLMAIPRTPEPYWDQFGENQRLFGTSSTYDPSMSAYTTPLVLESLTHEQIAKAEALSKIPLPSESLGNEKCCTFCHTDFGNRKGLVDHFLKLITSSSEESVCSSEGLKAIKSILRRKSWIIVQESLPSGLVSQIEGIYDRPISSSTNILMIFESIGSIQDNLELKEYLLDQLCCLAIQLAVSSSSFADKKRPITNNF